MSDIYALVFYSKKRNKQRYYVRIDRHRLHYASKAKPIYYTSLPVFIGHYVSTKFSTWTPLSQSPLRTQSSDCPSYASNVLVISFIGKKIVAFSPVRAISIRGSKWPAMISSPLFQPCLSHSFHCSRAKRSAAHPSSAFIAVWSLTLLEGWYFPYFMEPLEKWNIM